MQGDSIVSLLLDLMVALITVGFIWYGVRRGFLVMLVNTCGRLLSCVVAYVASRALATTIYNVYIHDRLVDSIASSISGSLADSDAAVQGEEYHFSMSFYMNPGETDLTWDAGIYRPEDVETPPPTINTIINRVVVGVQTGDPTVIGALAAIMAASAGMVVLLVRRKRKKMNAE